VAYRSGVIQKRSGGVVWSQPRKYRYGIPSMGTTGMGNGRGALVPLIML